VTVLKNLEYRGLEPLLRRHWRELAAALMLFTSASCVPLDAAGAPPAALAAAAAPLGLPGLPPSVAQPPQAEPMALRLVSPAAAAAINAAIPISTAPNPRATSMVFRAGTVWDRLNSLECLAQAVYYEAGTEAEEGQRAVAQVVLNRVRSPAYPNSVCGVVYQGPMRAGGGCQFTFTCDGALARPAVGPAWDRARRIAAAALAGSVFAPVGYATHYHTQQVVPYWAYRLVKTAVIGAHSFYRMPGGWGEPGAFRQLYAGREPSPSAIVAARLPATLAPTALALATSFPNAGYATGGAAPAAAPPDNLPQVRYTDNLPQSRVREEYRNSGAIRVQPGEAAPVR